MTDSQKALFLRTVFGLGAACVVAAILAAASFAHLLKFNTGISVGDLVGAAGASIAGFGAWFSWQNIRLAQRGWIALMPPDIKTIDVRDRFGDGEGPCLHLEFRLYMNNPGASPVTEVWIGVDLYPAKARPEEIFREDKGMRVLQNGCIAPRDKLEHTATIDKAFSRAAADASDGQHLCIRCVYRTVGFRDIRETVARFEILQASRGEGEKGPAAFVPGKSGKDASFITDQSYAVIRMV